MKGTTVAIRSVLEINPTDLDSILDDIDRPLSDGLHGSVPEVTIGPSALATILARTGYDICPSNKDRP